MKHGRKTACGVCPFRRTSFAGWLGQATADQFITATVAQLPMPCHSSIDYEDPDWETTQRDTDVADFCIGAATFLRNTCAMPRGEYLAQVVRATPANREQFFANRAEFMAHHDTEAHRTFHGLSDRDSDSESDTW